MDKKEEKIRKKYEINQKKEYKNIQKKKIRLKIN